MDFSEHKGIYVIGALANGKIQKVTGELTSLVPISRIRHPR